MSASAAPECNEVKELVALVRTTLKNWTEIDRRYDSCFLKWYSEKFLRGSASTDECEPLFKDYNVCLTKALKERGIDKLLEEARESNKDIDAENMRRR